MRDNIINNQYDASLRFILCRWRELKKMPLCAERDRLLENCKERIQGARRALQKIAQPPEYIDIVPDENYPEYYTRLYTKPFTFEGTKAEFDKYLWDEHATQCAPSQYDCTGQHFTSGYKIAHIGGNRWRVAEYRGVDV